MTQREQLTAAAFLGTAQQPVPAPASSDAPVDRLLSCIPSPGSPRHQLDSIALWTGYELAGVMPMQAAAGEAAAEDQRALTNSLLAVMYIDSLFMTT